MRNVFAPPLLRFSIGVSRVGIRHGSCGIKRRKPTPDQYVPLAPGYGEKIYVFAHDTTGQVVYSLHPQLRLARTLKQLRFNGKKSVPDHLRKDYWNYLALIRFPEGAAKVGRSVYTKLLELKDTHQLEWGYQTKEFTAMSREDRAKALNNMRSNAIADMAAALGGMGRGNLVSSPRKEVRAAIAAIARVVEEREREAAEAAEAEAAEAAEAARLAAEEAGAEAEAVGGASQESAAAEGAPPKRASAESATQEKVPAEGATQEKAPVEGATEETASDEEAPEETAPVEALPVQIFPDTHFSLELTESERERRKALWPATIYWTYIWEHNRAKSWPNNVLHVAGLNPKEHYNPERESGYSPLRSARRTTKTAETTAANDTADLQPAIAT